MAVSIRAAIHRDRTDAQRSLLPVRGQREVLDISAGLLLEGEDCISIAGCAKKFFIRQTCYKKGMVW